MKFQIPIKMSHFLQFICKFIQLSKKYFCMESGNPYFHSEDTNAIYDIFVLLKYYDDFFFDGILEKCTIEWSTKMTLCAGTCQHKGFGSCCIKLSAPLLKYRTPNELKQTILHEMIHAFLFITNPKACMTEGGHGKEFKEIMNNINAITKLRVTVYHSFIDEVESYRTHVWRCNGICKQRAPHYGYVKRSMNRKPQPADSWWKEHQRYCGGEFIKISEPQNTKKTTLKNGKTLKTNTQLQKKSSENFIGKGKTLQDYAKEMQTKQIKKTSSANIQKIEDRQNFEQKKLPSNILSTDKKIEQKSDIKIEKQKSRNKSKVEKQQRNSHKITEWFQNKGKTIEEYTKQIQEDKIMYSMSFNQF